MKTLKVPVLASLVLAGLASVCQADIIYQDNFNRVGTLAGSAPTIDNTGMGAVWVGDPGYSTDGTNCIAPVSSWTWPIISLPWDPVTYTDPTITCNVKLDDPTTGDWLGIGFGATNSYWAYHLYMTLSGDGHVSAYYGYTWAQTTILNNVLMGIPGGWNTISLQYSNTPVDASASNTVSVIVNGTYALQNLPLDASVTGADVGGGLQLMQFNNGSGRIANFVVTFGTAASVPPTIDTEPASTTEVFQGDPVILTTRAEGTLPLAYQWYKGGAAIPGANSGNYSVAATTTNDTGNYTLVITNVAGSITSTVAQVTVHLEADKVLAEQNFDGIGTGYDYSYVYSDPAYVNSSNIPSSATVTSGVGVGGSSALVIACDGTAWGLTNHSWAGLGGVSVINMVAPLTTTNLLAIECSFAACLGNLLPTVSNSPFRAMLEFKDTNGTTLFMGTKSIVVASNFQTYSITMNTTDCPGATNLSRVAMAALELSADSISTDFTNAPNDFYVMDNILFVQRMSPALGTSYNGVHTTITWADPTLTLQSATNVTGPFTDVAGATSPYTVSPSGKKFYRTRW
jgi:hypothetical protein